MTIYINKNSSALLGDLDEGLRQLFTAIAPLASQHVSSEAFRVHASQHRLFASC